MKNTQIEDTNNISVSPLGWGCNIKQIDLILILILNLLFKLFIFLFQL